MKANSVILKRGLMVFVVLVALLALVSVASFAAFQPPVPAAERIDVLIGFEGAPNPGLVRAFGGEIYAEFSIVDVIGARMSEQQANALRRNPAVSYIEPDGIVYTTGQTVPWGIDRVFGTENYSFQTWINSSGNGIGVAVLDTGIDVNHEDLTVVGGRRFYLQGFRLRSDNNYNDVHGHGTHVAGTIAALNNYVGVVGVAPTADLYAVKVLTDSGSGSVSAIVAGIEWVVNHGNIQIINMSLGSSSYSQTFKDACDKADAAGILVISSAGNSGNTGGTGDNVGYPAKYDSVVAVAASDINDNRAWFSSTGPAVELIAPGVAVNSTVPGGYAAYNGTSMASPHVAGVAALVWAADSSLSNEQVRSILKETAEDLALDVNHQGHGLVRADLAVAEVAGSPTTYTLILEVAPAEAGTVEGAGDYEEGQNASISAIANEGFKFVNWTLGGIEVSSNSTYDYTMPAENVTLVANFTETYTLTLLANPAEGGTVSGAGEYEAGDKIKINALAEDGYDFDNWTIEGTVVSSDASSDYIMPANDVTLVANFKKVDQDPVETYTLTLLADPAEAGSVTGAGDYEAGEEITITASANEGYEFVNWTASAGTFANSTAAETTFTMPAEDVTVTAVFRAVDDDPDDPPAEGTVTVSSIDYTTSGGREQNRHLHITVSLIDDSGNPVPGAAVSINVLLNGSTYNSQTGTTGANGTVTFNYNNHPSGRYETNITALEADGFTWDGEYPDNEYVK